MWELATIIALTVFYGCAQACVRQWKLSTLLVVFGLAPLVLTPFWVKSNRFDIFVWIKIYSMMFCICWGGWVRYGKQYCLGWVRSTIPLLLAANIWEAVCVDIMGESFAQWLNALAGIYLITFIPYGSTKTYVDGESTHRDLQCDLTRSWIIGYTLWNWTFVYLNYPAFIGHHTAVLAAALIVGWKDPQLWVQARAATLGTTLFWMATNCEGVLRIHDGTAWFNPALGLVAASVAFTWVVLSSLYCELEGPARLVQGLYQSTRVTAQSWADHLSPLRSYPTLRWHHAVK